MSGLATLSDISSIVVGLIAVLALYLAWRQIAVSRELSAMEAYENYHSMCLQYAEYTSGEVEFEKFSPAKLRHYEIYVLYTLMMCERIYALFPDDAGWLFSIEDDIKMHLPFIKSEFFATQLDNQQWNILPIIKRVINEANRELS
jgi:hypothetical protein